MDCEAVILCNADSERLYPFTSEGHPDCLLPVLTRPLVSYPLASLKAANVQHVLLVPLQKPSKTFVGRFRS